MPRSDRRALKWLEKYLRYVNYVGAAQLYLKENVLMREPLEEKHFKARILGHWGTVPGINLIYAHLNYLIHKHDCEMLLVTGPGHGAPANLANLYLEGTLKDVYKDYTLDEAGLTKIVRDFSWPHSPFPSHVTPTVPGSILEGGELGYSLATAYGSVLDNPNLITAVIVGDGESETGPIAAAWHANKFLNPKTSGAVLPILHINGYKISNPTLPGRMSDEELLSLYKGYGYDPIIVSGMRLDKRLNKAMMKAMEQAYQKIRRFQERARSQSEPLLKPKWPVILLRTPKGLAGPDFYRGDPIKDSFHAHGIPVGHPSEQAEALEAVERWLESYDIEDLVDEKGTPVPALLEFVPKGKKRLGMSKYAVGGNLMKALKLPKLSKYEVKFKEHGSKKASSMKRAGQFYRDLIANNPKNFRMFCPDELESNKLSAVFEKTGRAFMWPLHENDEHMDANGRVIEMLSEHTLQGMLSGYLLTGRHGVFVSYEAFTTIIGSMVDQYAKFLKQSFAVAWRKPISSAVYINSSTGWRQDHNGYSHQNPSFVSGVLQKHGEFSQIYYPADANMMLVALEEVYSKKDSICVIVAGKRDLPQWLSLKEAREQAKVGIGIWDWVGGKTASKSPDVVLASAGDYITQEAIYAVQLCKELLPEMKIRYVNVSELTALNLGDNLPTGKGLRREDQVNKYFTKDKPVVFSYHGYVNDIEQILWPYTSSERFSLHGYEERGSTTTPFDMKVANGVSRYHLAIDMMEQAMKHNKKLVTKGKKGVKELENRIKSHQKYIQKMGDDPAYVKEMRVD